MKINRVWLSQVFDSDKKFIFVHVPKCGGTSLDSLMRKKFRFSRFKMSAANSVKTSNQINQEKYLVRNVLLNYAVNVGYKFISGHYYLHQPELYEDHQIITILRDPVKRFVSHYLYNRHKTHSTLDSITMEFEDFLNSDLAINYGNLFCRYFSENQSVKESIATLDKFAAVGILENLTPLETYISKELKLNHKITKENKSPSKKKDRSLELLSTYKSQIQELCSDDIKIYNHFNH